MSQVKQAMALLIAAFHKYSGKEGDKYTLSKGELKDLLQNEFGDCKDCINKEKIEKVFKQIDADADGSVDFHEFITLVAVLTTLVHEFFREKDE